MIPLNNEKRKVKIDAGFRKVSLTDNQSECGKTVPVFQVQKEVVKKGSYEVNDVHCLHDSKNNLLRRYINQILISMRICQVYR